MQSKLTFIVLFMLLFTVVHDTAIFMLDDCKDSSALEYINGDKQVSTSDAHDMHEIFHFIALVQDTDMHIGAFSQDCDFPNYKLQFTLPYLKSASKPPIV